MARKVIRLRYMPSAETRFAVRDIWNEIFNSLGSEGRMLGTSIFLSHKALGEVFPRLVSAYVADRRREWSEVELLPTDSSRHVVIRFSAPTREPVQFLVEATKRGSDMFSYRAYSVAGG